LSLEEQDGAVTEIEVDEVLGLCAVVSELILYPCKAHVITVGYEASEISADYAMPCSAFTGIELGHVNFGGTQRQLLHNKPLF
jgi:hypothetical protein